MARLRRRAREKGGLAEFRCFESIIRLIRYCEQNQPDPIDMTDEEVALFLDLGTRVRSFEAPAKTA